MGISHKQAYVLANLERVLPLAYKVKVRSPFTRFQLDGWECTAQITGLVVRGWIAERRDGSLHRLAIPL